MEKAEEISSEKATMKLLVVVITVLLIGLLACIFFIIHIVNSKDNNTSEQNSYDKINQSSQYKNEDSETSLDNYLKNNEKNKIGNSESEIEQDNLQSNIEEKKDDEKIEDESVIYELPELTLSNKTFYMNITDLEIFNGSMLQFRLKNNNKITLKTGTEFAYDPAEVSVDSEGRASLPFRVDLLYYRESDLPLYLSLDEIVPDSEGNPHSFNLGEEIIIF